MIIKKNINKGKIYIFLTKEDVELNESTFLKNHIASFYPICGNGQVIKIVKKIKPFLSVEIKKEAIENIRRVIEEVYSDQKADFLLKDNFEIDLADFITGTDFIDVESFKSTLKIKRLLLISN